MPLSNRVINSIIWERLYELESFRYRARERGDMEMFNVYSSLISELESTRTKLTGKGMAGYREDHKRKLKGA